MRPALPTASTDVPATEDSHYNQYITVTLTSDNQIYYTTDGQYPSTAQPVYTSPIKLPGGETKIQALAVDSKGLVSQLATYTYTVADVIEKVDFEDAAIEASIRDILKADDTTDIYTSDLWGISEFTVPADAKSYADLPHLAFLQKLTIENGVKEELIYISELSNLTELTIVNTEVTPDVLDGISLLPLQRLTLSKCKLYDITALKNTSSLLYLDLSDNSISIIDALSSLLNLQELNLRYNNISDLSALSVNTSLKTLDISQNTITTLAPLTTLTVLAKLDARENMISDLGNITQLTALSSLNLASNQLKSLIQLTAHPTLETLNVSGNLLTNVDQLATLPSLKYLDFSYNEVAELPAFEKESELVSITCSRNKLSSLENLSGLKNLNVVNVEYNEAIKSAKPLASCPILFQVYLYGTAVTDVDLLTVQGIVVNFNPVQS
jgi:hypothetical protein